jgi:cell division protein FtsQ
MARTKRTEESAGDPGREARLDAARRHAAAIARVSVLTIACTAVIVGCGYGAIRFDQFLREDSRFTLLADEPGMEKAPIEITGTQNASRTAILKVFAVDRGRSLYLLKPDERRRQILALEWVKDASVRRVWPHRVAVAISERTPVAFVAQARPAESTTDPDAAVQAMLIDADGVILAPHGKVTLQLPLLSGLRARDTMEVRRDRVRRMLLLLKELDAYRGQILEVDVSHPDNLRIVYQTADQATTLVLGAENYQSRMKRFLEYYPQVKEKVPEHAVLDLRIEDRITIAP